MASFEPGATHAGTNPLDDQIAFKLGDGADDDHDLIISSRPGLLAAAPFAQGRRAGSPDADRESGELDERIAL